MARIASNQSAGLRYRGIPMRHVACSMLEAARGDEELHENDDGDFIYMLIGYSPPLDCFVYLTMAKAPFFSSKVVDAAEEVCALCLGQLHTPDTIRGLAVRVYGSRCFHDLHLECRSELSSRQMSLAACCGGAAARTHMTYHLRVVGHARLWLRGVRDGGRRLEEARLAPKDAMAAAHAAPAIGGEVRDSGADDTSGELDCGFSSILWLRKSDATRDFSDVEPKEAASIIAAQLAEHGDYIALGSIACIATTRNYHCTAWAKSKLHAAEL